MPGGGVGPFTVPGRIASGNVEVGDGNGFDGVADDGKGPTAEAEDGGCDNSVDAAGAGCAC